MKRPSTKGITAFLMVGICYALLFHSTAVCKTDDEASKCENPITEEPDYRSEDRFRIMLSRLAAENMYSAANNPGSEAEDPAACFQEFLENEIEKPLSLAQYQQVLFFLAESHFMRGEFKAADQRYSQLKLLIRDPSDPMFGQVNRRLQVSRKKARSDAWKNSMSSFPNEHRPVIIAAAFLLFLLVLAGKFIADWQKSVLEKFKESNSLPEADQEAENLPESEQKLKNLLETEEDLKNFLEARIVAPDHIDVWKMREHDGRISERTLREYMESRDESRPDEDEKRGTARLIFEGYAMIQRVNRLAPYPIAVIAKISGELPGLNKWSYFWQYTIFGFLLIAFWGLAGVPGEDPPYEIAVRLFLIAAFVISSLTCLRIMARSTVNALDEMVSMLEPPRKKYTGMIPPSVLQIEKNMNFLFRSPWQFFVALALFLLTVAVLLITREGDKTIPETAIMLVFVFIIILIAAPIIWMLIGSVNVLNDISKIEDLAINPLSPLKTMGLEKWASVIGTYGVSSSIVLTFGCSIPVITGALENSAAGSDWFWFTIILPLLFFYWVYPYLKLSSMVKQQKTDRMQIIKTKISHIFNEWMFFEEKQLERLRECQEKQDPETCNELFDFRKEMARNLKPYLEPMNKYYEVFKKIDESPHSYVNFFSVLELGKALGIPSLFAILSAWLL